MDLKNYPIFNEALYYKDTVSTTNTVTFDVRKFPTVNKNTNKKLNYEEDLYVCTIHRNVFVVYELSEKCCDNCIKFSLLNCSFIIKSNFGHYVFPPAILFTSKKFNLIRSFFEACIENFDLKKEDIINMRRIFEINEFEKLRDQADLITGSLPNLQTGKTGYPRNKIMGFLTHIGIRGTFISKPDAPIGYISINKHIYDLISDRLASDIVIGNRSPSLTDKCIYPFKLSYYESDYDNTIHGNTYIMNGMNLDIDGDELTLYLFLKKSTFMTPNQKAALIELNDFYERRMTLLNDTKYTLCQIHLFYAYKYRYKYDSISEVWRNTEGITFKDKCKNFMRLAGTTHKEECDNLLQILSEDIRNSECHATCEDLLGNTTLLEDIVKSGAKGTLNHIQEYLQLLQTPTDPNIFYEETSTYYNQLVQNSNQMTHAGKKCFESLVGRSNIVLDQCNIYCCDQLLIKDFLDSEISDDFVYNEYAIDYFCKKTKLCE